MAPCNFIDDCSFYQERKSGQSLMWRWLVQDYCLGSLYPNCAIRGYFLVAGEGAPEGLVPSGGVDDDLLKR